MSFPFLPSFLPSYLPRVGGTLEVNESRVILVPNVPWLKSGTVKDNILFGSAYRREDYESVIDACGLREDFKRLPLKDRVRHSLGMVNMGLAELLCSCAPLNDYV